MRFIKELLSSPHIIIADGDSNSLVNLIFLSLPCLAVPTEILQWMGGSGETTALTCPFLSSYVINCFYIKEKWTACHLFSSHTSFFSTNNSPPQHISNLYYLTPPPLLHPIFIFFFSSPTHQKRTRNFPHTPNNTHNYSFSLSTQTHKQVHQSSLQRTPCRICTWWWPCQTQGRWTS